MVARVAAAPILERDGKRLVLFVLVHVAMVVLSGPFNNMRSMITGWFTIQPPGYTSIRSMKGIAKSAGTFPTSTPLFGGLHEELTKPDSRNLGRVLEALQQPEP